MRVSLLAPFFLVGCGVATSVALAETKPIRTPYAQQAALGIRSVTIPSATIRQFDCVEIPVDLIATFDNPFATADITLDAHILAPDGTKLDVPGFFFQAYERREQNGREVLSPQGKPGWRIRFTPVLQGQHRMTVTGRDRSGKVESAPLSFTVPAGDSSGFVRISSRDRRYFAFDNGRAFFPIGLNMCWPGNDRKTFDYDQWMPAFARAGCNATRLWLAPDWFALSLERPGRTEDGRGMGQLDLASAWRIDHVLDLARQHGIFVKLCFDSFNELRHRDCYNFWEKAPQNAANGGPLATSKEFWTSPDMDRFYRDKLRYLVARYGAATHVLSWEFWNEVDIISDYPAALVRDWHVRMARYLRSIDPYKHLITTSFADSAGDSAIDALPEIDYVQTHLYGGVDPVRRLADHQRRKHQLGKPHYVGEFGADAGGGRFAEDPEGVQIHDLLWLCAANGDSGLGQPWYWETIHAQKQHALFAAAAKFTAGIDWPAEGMHSVEPRCRWLQAPSPLPRRDIDFEVIEAQWSDSEYNRPRTVRVDRSGVHGQMPLANIQYGTTAHKEWHNPVRVEIDLPWATKYGVHVRNVSGWSGAKLALRLDGRMALEKDFPNTNPPGAHKDLLQYTGWYEIDVPAGKHVVEVENTGVDWFYCDYRLRDGLECPQPPLLAWATVGRNTALAWVRLEARSWTHVCITKEPIRPVAPSVLTIPQIAPGRWKAELWDTWAGKILQTVPIDVSSDREAHISLPEITKDIAVQLKRMK